MKKIYILVHSWLAPANRAVQAAHVVQGWAAAKKDMHIILLETGKATPQKDLHDAMGVAGRIGLVFDNQWKYFQETKDCNGGQVTAVGFVLDSDLSVLPETIQSQMVIHLTKFKLAS